MKARTQVALWSEVHKVLGGTEQAAAMARDLGLLARLVPLANRRGPGDWAGCMPSRFAALAEHVARIVCPGEAELLTVLNLGEFSMKRISASFSLRRGVRLQSPEGRVVQLKAGTFGALALGQPDPFEDLEDLAAGLGSGQVALFLVPFVPHGLLLGAQATAGSAWWPAAPRTGPRPSRRK